MGRVTNPPSKKEELRNIGRSLSMVLDTKKSNFGKQQCLRFHIWFIVTLYYKMWQTLLLNLTAILLQNATKGLLQNASGVLLQNETVITKCLEFITKSNSYYKMRCLAQNASVHRVMAIEVNSDTLQPQPKPKKSKKSNEFCSKLTRKAAEWPLSFSCHLDHNKIIVLVLLPL